MVATVRLSSELEETLNDISQKLHKKKSDIIREAISFYAKSLEDSKKTRLQDAIKKTNNSDFNEYKDMEDSINDGL
jgi:predicted DNA-binding protein